MSAATQSHAITRVETRTYIGRRLSNGNTVAHLYIDGNGVSHAHSAALIVDTPIGTQLQVTLLGEQVYVGGEREPRVIGQTPDEASVLLWIAEEKADLTVANRVREARRLVKEGRDPMRERLEPIRDELAKMSSERRAATIWWIVGYLSEGTRR